MTGGELRMDDNDRQWIQREFDDLKGRVDNKPCVAHGEELAAIRQHMVNGDTLKAEKRDWFKVGISIGVLILGIAMAVFAYAEYVK